MEENIDIAKSWDAVATEWDKRIEPIVQKGDFLWGPYGPEEKEVHLLPTVQGKKVLVAGCGSGPDVWWLAKHGATVTGVDISTRQLDLAQKRMQESGLKAAFAQVDLNKFSKILFPSESFDLIISNYAFQYVSDKKKLFGALAHFCRKGGKLIFSHDHPILYATYLKYQERDRRKSFRTFDYLNERTIVWHFRVTHKSIPAYSYHHTISTISNALTEGGFILEKMLEPKPTVKPTGSYGKSYELAKRLPYTIIFVASKK